MNLTFRPTLETMDARELPAIVFKDLIVSSVVLPRPAVSELPAVQLAPAGDGEAAAQKTAGYDLKALKKV